MSLYERTKERIIDHTPPSIRYQTSDIAYKHTDTLLLFTLGIVVL